jgi:geranylgeranylglycerol-phosphate geranylgeranyltransferase
MVILSLRQLLILFVASGRVGIFGTATSGFLFLYFCWQVISVYLKKLLAVLKLTRIEHSLMLVIAVIAAELLAGGLPQPGPLALSLIAPVFISMASFAINDYFDVEVDMLNNKRRPLVTGLMTKKEALYVTAVSLIIGVSAGALININCFVIAFVFAALAMLYSYKLKEMLVVGNAYIALAMVIPFFFGNYVVSSTVGEGIVLISAMIFFSGLAREIHGTIRDYEGDVKARKVRTIPTAIGIMPASLLALVLYLAAAAVSAYLFFNIAPFKSNLAFGALIALSDALLLYVGFSHVSKNAKTFYGIGRNVSLIAMGIALVAIMLSPLVGI